MQNRFHPWLLISVTLMACSSEPVKKEEPAPPARAVQSEAVTSEELRVSSQSPQLKSITIEPSSSDPQLELPQETMPALADAGGTEAKAGEPSAPALPNDPAQSVKEDPALPAKVDHSASLPAKEDHSPAPPSGVAPEKALGWLKNGNTRYVKNRLRADGASASDRTRLASGQKPHAIVLSCSDSRVPPEIVFDQKLGEIFVVRTAGEGLDAAGLASIEYAVAHLGPRLILVMGHDSCGAVAAAIKTPQGQSGGSASLDTLIGDIRPRLTSVWDGQPSSASPELKTEVKANAIGVAKDLTKRSEILKKAVESGQVRVESAVYHLASGEVEFH